MRDSVDFARGRALNDRQTPASTRFGPRSISMNAVWSILTYVVRGTYQWGLLIAIAKMGTPEMVGQVALGLAICAPVFLFSDLQLRVVQATDARDDFHFRDYLGLRLLSTPLAFVMVLSIALASGYRWETFLVVGTVALTKVPESLSDCIHGAMQKSERLDMVATSTMARFLGSLVAFLAVFYYSGSIPLSVLSQLLISTLVLVINDRLGVAKLIDSQLHGLSPRFEWPLLFKLAKVALPLGLVAMIVSFSGNLPRYVLERSWGEVSLGVYAAILQPTLVGQVIMSGIGQSTMPRLAKCYATGDIGHLTRLVVGLIGIAIIMGGIMVALAFCWGTEILTLFYRHEYAKYKDVFEWLMVAGAIGYVCTALGSGLSATRSYQRYLAFYTPSAVFSASLALFLIPSLGLKGAAWTVCCTHLTSGAFLSCLFVTLMKNGKSPERH